MSLIGLFGSDRSPMSQDVVCVSVRVCHYAQEQRKKKEFLRVLKGLREGPERGPKEGALRGALKRGP